MLTKSPGKSCSKSGRESWAAGASNRALPVKSIQVGLEVLPCPEDMCEPNSKHLKDNIFLTGLAANI